MGVMTSASPLLAPWLSLDSPCLPGPCYKGGKVITLSPILLSEPNYRDRGRALGFRGGAERVAVSQSGGKSVLGWLSAPRESAVS